SLRLVRRERCGAASGPARPARRARVRTRAVGAPSRLPRASAGGAASASL
ncbi:MAG: hypothetical protein AVDCRST_MAG45-961, partial [uncultured Solirubrobacterales bacterium]